MTTIAWDGRYLAVDRLALVGGLQRQVCKLHECGLYVYSGCGTVHEVARIAEWLRTGAKVSESPNFEEGSGGGWGIAVLRSSGVALHITGNPPAMVRYFDERQADGAGRDFALSAMSMGKTAAESVIFASRFNVDTGSEVDVYDSKTDTVTQFDLVSVQFSGSS